MVYQAEGCMGGTPSKQAQTGGELKARVRPHGKCFIEARVDIQGKA